MNPVLATVNLWVVSRTQEGKDIMILLWALKTAVRYILPCPPLSPLQDIALGMKVAKSVDRWSVLEDRIRYAWPY